MVCLDPSLESYGGAVTNWGFMDFALTEEQDLIRDCCGQGLRGFPDEYWRKKTRPRVPLGFLQHHVRGGWIGIAIPEAYGGSGRGITEASIVLEEVAASGAAMNGATPLHLSMLAWSRW